MLSQKSLKVEKNMGPEGLMSKKQNRIHFDNVVQGTLVSSVVARMEGFSLRVFASGKGKGEIAVGVLVNFLLVLLLLGF